MILLWQHNPLTEQVLSPLPLDVRHSRNRLNPIHFSSPPRSLLPLIPASCQLNTRWLRISPSSHLLHVTYLFPVSFSRHDTVATFLHHFMHLFPMNARFMLILSPFVPRYLLHPSLSLSLLPHFTVPPRLSVSLHIRFLLSLVTLSVPLYPLFIPWLFVRSRLVHVYIHIDPHASNLTIPFRVICLMSPFSPSLIFLPPQFVFHASLWLQVFCEQLQALFIEYFPLLFNFHVHIIAFPFIRQHPFLTVNLSCLSSLARSRFLRCFRGGRMQLPGPPFMKTYYLFSFEPLLFYLMYQVKAGTYGLSL